MPTIREEVEAQHAAREQGMYALCQRLAGDLSTPSIRAAIRQHECSGITTEQLFDTILEARIAEAVAANTERCASIAEGQILDAEDPYCMSSLTARTIAAAIRGDDHDG